MVNRKYKSLILCTMHMYIAAFHENCPRGTELQCGKVRGRREVGMGTISILPHTAIVRAHNNRIVIF